ncbi:MAG: transposase [Anaerolineales bacterium]|nr:transposase [Anaerolineales bacterium]
MFRKNTKHQQPALISAASELPEKQRKRLENSWAGAFYKEFFSRVDEQSFAVLYSEKDSRPNVPVNVLVGLEALKAGFGWSDQELYENYCYDLQVRYALGYDRLGDGDFEIRSLYYFRERLSKYNTVQGINLLEKAFEQITDAQIMDLKIRTGMQRMDSTQIASNIVSASRLQLLVASVQRVERILNEADRVRLTEIFAPYIKDSAGHYIYRVKGREAVQEHLQKIGKTIHVLLQDLKSAYAAETAYQVLERIFAENFHLIESDVRTKENTEITSSCLQSVDDLEATYRTKGTGHYKGYVANITETCDPENEIQLITKVQVAPNNVDDGQLLAEALPNLKERTDVDTLVTDGGYGGEVSDSALQEQNVGLIQTAIRGAQPDPNKFNLSDFSIQQNEKDDPATLTCPQGQTVPVLSGRTTGWQARFDPAICFTCPFQLDGRCRTQPQKRDLRYLLTFTTHEMRAAKRRKDFQSQRNDSHNLRSAVEGTVRSVKHPFPAGKLPVRGQFRVTCMAIASAATANVRRIHRYLMAKMKQAQAAKSSQAAAVFAAAISFFVFLARWLRSRLAFSPIFGY